MIMTVLLGTDVGTQVVDKRTKPNAPNDRPYKIM